MCHVYGFVLFYCIRCLGVGFRVEHLAWVHGNKAFCERDLLLSLHRCI